MDKCEIWLIGGTAKRGSLAIHSFVNYCEQLCESMKSGSQIPRKTIGIDHQTSIHQEMAAPYRLIFFMSASQPSRISSYVSSKFPVYHGSRTSARRPAQERRRETFFLRIAACEAGKVGEVFLIHAEDIVRTGIV